MRPVFRRNSCYASSRYFTQTVPVKHPSGEMRANSSSVYFNRFGQRHLWLKLYVGYISVCVWKMSMWHWICHKVTLLFRDCAGCTPVISALLQKQDNCFGIVDIVQHNLCPRIICICFKRLILLFCEAFSA